MAKINFKIVTPERTVLSKEIDSLTCPTEMGQITVLPNHIPLIAALQPGEMIVKNGSSTEHMAVSGGFIEVRPKSEVVVLADTAEMAAEIDPERAAEAKRRAEEEMKKTGNLSDQEYAILASVIKKNLARMHVARRRTHRASGINEAASISDNENAA